VCYVLLRKAGWESASSVNLKVLWNITYIIQFLVHPVGGSMSENKKTISHKALACLLTCSSAIQPSDSLGLLNYRCLFFPVNCLLSPSLNLHLPQILLYIFQPSQSRFCLLLLISSLLSNISLTVPSLIHSYYMSIPLQSFLFNICYCV